MAGIAVRPQSAEDIHQRRGDELEAWHAATDPARDAEHAAEERSRTVVAQARARHLAWLQAQEQHERAARELIEEFFLEAQRTMPLTRATYAYSVGSREESLWGFLMTLLRIHTITRSGAPVYERTLVGWGYVISSGVLLEPPSSADRSERPHDWRVWSGSYSPAQGEFIAKDPASGGRAVVPLQSWKPMTNLDQLRDTLAAGLSAKGPQKGHV